MNKKYIVRLSDPLLQSEIGIWSDKTNAKQRGVDWQFKIDDARTKMKRLFPKI